MVRAAPEVAVVVSVDGLLDTHEVAVHARVDSLRERAARVAVELGEAELGLEHVAITRATLAAAISGSGLDLLAQDASAAEHGASAPTVVPMWRMGLAVAHLPDGCRLAWRAVGDAPTPWRAKEIAVALGLEVSAATVEGLRCKLKRLVARGWLTEPMPGAFALAAATA